MALHEHNTDDLQGVLAETQSRCAISGVLRPLVPRDSVAADAKTLVAVDVGARISIHNADPIVKIHHATDYRRIGWASISERLPEAWQLSGVG